MAAPVARFLADTARKPFPWTASAARRRFASSARHDDAQEAARWEKITDLGVATCTVLAAYLQPLQGPPPLPRPTGALPVPAHQEQGVPPAVSFHFRSSYLHFYRECARPIFL